MLPKSGCRKNAAIGLLSLAKQPNGSIVAKDTIEQQILALHADKRELISGVLDGADRAGRISTDELVSLIKLSQAES